MAIIIKEGLRFDLSDFRGSIFIYSLRTEKDGEKFYKIVQANDWIDKLNEWIKTFISGVELTKGKMMAAYRFTEDEEETNNMFQSVRCKALAVLHNYFVFKTNADRKNMSTLITWPNF